jgi:very-short-patch-repair endonuclease
MIEDGPNPPRNGEGDRPAQPGGGGGPALKRLDAGKLGPLRQRSALPPPRSGEDLSRRQPEVLRQPIKQVKRARQLRKEMSLPEVLLWIDLQKRPGGYKFRKQLPQAPLTLDFACLRARLVIEVDGEAHSRGDQPKRDAARDRLMAERGFRTLRLPAWEVLSDMQSVITHIVGLCDERGPPPPPLRGGPLPRSGEDL